LAKEAAEKLRSKSGSVTAHGAWWTTRSRKGAALIRRRLGSRMMNEA
jgi:hypothetical protein